MLSKDLKNMVANGRVDKALKALAAIAEDQGWEEEEENTIIALRAQYCRAQEEKRLGLGSNRKEFRRIDMATLGLISLYKDRLPEVENKQAKDGDEPLENGKLTVDKQSFSLAQYASSLARIVMSLLF